METTFSQSRKYINYSVRRNEVSLRLDGLELINFPNTAIAGLTAFQDSLTTSTFSITKTTNSQVAPWWNDECERGYRCLAASLTPLRGETIAR